MDVFSKKIKEIFDFVIESGSKYEGSIENPDYYNLFCKAASKDQLWQVLGNNICAFNYTFKNQDSVLLVFSIPINTPEETGAKNVAERVMDIIGNMERILITLDYANSKEVKEDKFIYITIIKKLEGKV
jgi:hypothetical protein